MNQTKMDRDFHSQGFFMRRFQAGDAVIGIAGRVLVAFLLLGAGPTSAQQSPIDCILLAMLGVEVDCESQSEPGFERGSEAFQSPITQLRPLLLA